MSTNNATSSTLSDLFNQYFNIREFDSPDVPGSGALNMDTDFLNRLAIARHIAGTPFRINSGYRTKDHHLTLTKKGYPTAKNSPHLKGVAADISVSDSTNRYKILQALLVAGFTRIGIADTFIHVDSDDSKTQSLIWMY